MICSFAFRHGKMLSVMHCLQRFTMRGKSKCPILARSVNAVAHISPVLFAKLVNEAKLRVRRSQQRLARTAKRVDGLERSLAGRWGNEATYRFHPRDSFPSTFYSSDSGFLYRVSASYVVAVRTYRLRKFPMKDVGRAAQEPK